MARKITAYFDGCCEPKNPGGTASFGAVIFVDAQRVWECSQIFFPEKGREKETSNNVAEYSGFIAILNWLIEKGYKEEAIQIFGDSNLVICQMFGDSKRNGKLWKIKKGFYKPLAHEAQEILKQFSNIRGEWIPREENSVADELSKAELIKAGIQFKIQPEK